MRQPVVRGRRRTPDATIAGGRAAAHVERPARRRSRASSASRRATPSDAGWCAGRGRPRHGARLYATILGSPTRAQRNADLRDAARAGGSRATGGHPVVGPARAYARAEAPYGAAPVALVAPTRSLRVGARRPAARASASSRRRPSSLPVRKGPAARRRARLRRASGSSRSARSSPRASVEKPGFLGRRAGTPRTSTSVGGICLVIVTVTLNAALDRTLTVPNFQLGHRHRASQGLTLAGGKGHQHRARAQAARRPRRRDRARGRPHRHAHRRGADLRGDPQRLRPHRRRVAHVDGGRRPDGRLVHGDQRVGAARRARGAGDAARQAALPLARRRRRRLRRLAAARRRGRRSTPTRSAT